MQQKISQINNRVMCSSAQQPSIELALPKTLFLICSFIFIVLSFSSTIESIYGFASRNGSVLLSTQSFCIDTVNKWNGFEYIM